MSSSKTTPDSTLADHSYAMANAPSGRTPAVLAADQQAFQDASQRLTAALDAAAEGASTAAVAEARLELRSLAVKLRDSGFWRHDKQGLRATVSLLWRADRFVSDHALIRHEGDQH